jgi:UPF0755 protein
MTPPRRLATVDADAARPGPESAIFVSHPRPAPTPGSGDAMTDSPAPPPRFGRAAAPNDEALPEPSAAETPLPDQAPPAAAPAHAAPAAGEPVAAAPIAPEPAAAAKPVPPAPRKPAPRSRGARSQTVIFLNFLLTCLVVAMVVGGGLLWYGRTAFDAPGPFRDDRVFTVKARSGVADIGDGLERAGLITDSRVFQFGVRAAGEGAALKAGEYAIPARASMRQIMAVIASGKPVMYSLTIPEGLTVDQALDRVAAQPELSGELPADTPPEGSLVADTQRFTRGMPRVQIVAKMMEDQKALVERIWAARAPGLPLADVNEFVTLASIVEKETGIDAERPQVAAVFVNRLNQGMRLQSDPTVIYGLFGGRGKPSDRPIFQSDLDKPTPYNTYRIKGLPPGPIANPGRAALEAVANPAPTADLYFVADGTGGHAFAPTLKEHNRNVARLRALEKERADANGAAEPQAQNQ